MIKKVILGLVVFLLLASCGSNKGLVSEDVTGKVKPLRQLEFDQVTAPDNFVVKARNIADFSYSNKNRFELYLNGKLVYPNNQVDNATPNYSYEMKLQPGYYEVEGIYYWNGGWKEERTKVSTPELVRVGTNRRTLLEIDIPKDWRGIVTEKDLVFNLSYEALFEDEAPLESESPQIVTETQGEKIRLQINTEPSNCDVIVDDQMVGSTPMSVWVDRNTSHVLQIKRENYRGILRLIDYEELKDRDKLFIIERLELLNPVIATAPPPALGNPVDSVATDTSASAAANNAANNNAAANPPVQDNPNPVIPAVNNAATNPPAENNANPNTAANPGTNNSTANNDSLSTTAPDSLSVSDL